MKTNNNFWQKFSIFFYVLTSLASLAAMYVNDNTYKEHPDFGGFVWMINLVVLLSLLGLLAYYNLQKKSKAYFWLNAALLYFWLVLLLKIAVNRHWLESVDPYYFISGNNLMGQALNVFNIILVLPLATFLALAAIRYIAEILKKERLLNLQKMILWSTFVLAADVCLAVLLFGMISGRVLPEQLKSSQAVGYIMDMSELEIGKVIDINYMDPRYAYEDIDQSFKVIDNTEILEAGKKISLSGLAEGQEVRVTYHHSDELDDAVKIEVIN